MISPDNCWRILDGCAQTIAKHNNALQVAYWVERQAGTCHMTLVLKIHGNPHDFLQHMQQHPQLLAWAQRQGLPMEPNALSQALNEVRLAMMASDDQEWVTTQEGSIVRTLARRPSPLQGFVAKELSAEYWAKVLSLPDHGQTADRWIKDLHSALTQAPTPTSRQRVQQLLMRKHHQLGTWEQEADQSWRWWAKDHPEWTSVLDQNEISFRHTYQGRPLVVLALEAGWVEGVCRWLEECHATPTLPLPAEHFSVANNTSLGTMPLWCWACLVTSPDMLKMLIERDPGLLGHTFHGQNALHWACLSGREDLIGWLVDNNMELLHQEDDQGALPAQYLPEHLDHVFDRLEQKRLQKNAHLF